MPPSRFRACGGLHAAGSTGPAHWRACFGTGGRPLVLGFDQGGDVRLDGAGLDLGALNPSLID